MENKRQPAWPSWSLVGLATLQVLVLVLVGREDSPLAPDRISVGDTIFGLSAIDQTGREVILEAGSPTVLLVFRSDCRHTLDAAEIWGNWLARNRLAVRTIAISDEPISLAWAYASSQDWQTDVWSVEGTRAETMEREVTRKTPWVFLLNSDGKVLAEGHGAQLKALALSQAPAMGGL